MIRPVRGSSVGAWRLRIAEAKRGVDACKKGDRGRERFKVQSGAVLVPLSDQPKARVADTQWGGTRCLAPGLSQIVGIARHEPRTMAGGSMMDRRWIFAVIPKRCTSRTLMRSPKVWSLQNFRSRRKDVSCTPQSDPARALSSS